jgi:hypothetical protein
MGQGGRFSAKRALPIIPAKVCEISMLVGAGFRAGIRSVVV